MAKTEVQEELHECPECHTQWSMDEIDWQCCFACGFPNRKDNEAELNDFDYE